MHYLKRNKYAEFSKVVEIHDRYGNTIGVRVRDRHGHLTGPLVSIERHIV